MFVYCHCLASKRCIKMLIQWWRQKWRVKGRMRYPSSHSFTVCFPLRPALCEMLRLQRRTRCDSSPRLLPTKCLHVPAVFFCSPQLTPRSLALSRPTSVPDARVLMTNSGPSWQWVQGCGSPAGTPAFPKDHWGLLPLSSCGSFTLCI